jgi:signal peptidase I
MYGSYYDKEFIIVDRFSYLDIPWIKEWKVKRGDVIVFKPWVSEERKYYIKRVIGLPWDNIKITDWKVYLKKAWTKEYIELDEPYLNEENKDHTYVRGWITEFEVPEWKYFVMWDNRNHSDDSRTCFNRSCTYSARDSYIEKKDIVWKLFLDLGYFNFKNFSFIQLELGIDTKPRWLSSQSTFDYKND